MTHDIICKCFCSGNFLSLAAIIKTKQKLRLISSIVKEDDVFNFSAAEVHFCINLLVYVLIALWDSGVILCFHHLKYSFTPSLLVDVSYSRCCSGGLLFGSAHLFHSFLNLNWGNTSDTAALFSNCNTKEECRSSAGWKLDDCLDLRWASLWNQKASD